MSGFVLWFTGLSGSGKSTLTTLVATELRRRGVHVETLDGDEIRRHLSKGLGFSRDDRDENIRRIGFVAKLVARSGACTIAAAISPYRAVRAEVRAGIPRFVEVYTECPVSVLAERDPKGLYRRALAGEIKNFTGVDDPYEAPEAPEVHLHTDREAPEQSVQRILAKLEALELVPRWGPVAGGRAVPGAGLPPPHGGELVDGLLSAEAAESARRAAEALPVIDLDEATLAEAVALASGAHSPLDGFMTRKDLRRVTGESRLESGLPWARIGVLPAPDALEPALRAASSAALRDRGGALVGAVELEDLYRDDAGRLLVGGRVRLFAAGVAPAATSPRAVRAGLAALRAQGPVALLSGQRPGPAEEVLLRGLLAASGAALVLVAGPAGGDLGARLLAWRELIDAARLAGRAFALAAPTTTTATDARDVIHAAVVARNHGAARLVLAEPEALTDAELHAGLARYLPGELGVDVVRAQPAPSTRDPQAALAARDALRALG